MSKGKCADEAGVVMELLSYGGDELAEALADIFTDILQVLFYSRKEIRHYLRTTVRFASYLFLINFR